ncbi:hypothetical protein Poly59_29930 [Rubripirellula reticaptiva]|uniref:Uncharacterized protein n=2 Tax=Rubripirellula reticaptiva TaxID=2528013 RepID=A0A5C6EW03_9BACT|nr:hypothetical protein Poly59_29930 [Rubripirellula reticaptiva]
MKKFVSLAIMFAAVAVLGTALTGVANDESSSSKAATTRPAERCCQDKAAELNASVAESSKLGCCSEAKAKATSFAKADGCSSESCKAGNQLAGTCELCAGGIATATSSKNQCPVDQTGQCGGKCGIDAEAPTVISTKAESQSHGPCKGGCKEECASCAEARMEAAANQTNLTTKQGIGPGMGLGHAGDSQHAKDHQDFFYLIEHRDDIRRTVKILANGVETRTESDVEDVARMIQTHVEAMYDRMEHANPIRMRDPLFREVFAHAKKIKLEIEHTDHGVRVTETADDAYAIKLVQEHAKVVSLWIKNGYAELPKNHAVPTH